MRIFRTASRPPARRRWLATACLAATLGGLAGGASHAAGTAPVRPPPTVTLVAFRNVTGDPAAVPRVMAAVTVELERRGLVVRGNGEVDRLLRERRIRARDALSRNEIRELGAALGVRYVLLGSIDAWGMNGGPEIGLTARLLETIDGDVVWAGEACLHAVDAPGLLAMGRPKTLEEASRRAARKLFGSLVTKRVGGRIEPRMPERRPRRSMLAPVPITYRSPAFDPRRPMRVAVLPLDNHSTSPDAPLVLGDRLLSQLLGLPRVEVVDPGELRRTLIDHDILPLYGVDLDQLAKLREILGVDGVVDGAVLRYGDDGAVPRIDLFVRLRDAETGEILWSATTSRGGERTRTIYDMGRIRGLDRLAETTLAEILSTWVR